MDVFVSRKRQRAEGAEAHDGDDAPPRSQEDTDFKLALLSSLVPDLEQTILLESLLAHNGHVEAAAASLSDAGIVQSPRKKSRVNNATGYQASLSSFNITAVGPDGRERKDPPKVLTKKGRTLHLYSPEDIERHTPCSLLLNFLPSELAVALTHELLDESPTYRSDTFKLFDRVVQSPHTFCFYVSNKDEAERQRTEYVYNGSLVEDVRTTLPNMDRAATIVEDAVNREVARRIAAFYPDGRKLKYMSPDGWRPNAAFVNCYDGPAQNVGYHSDELTYLGPRAVIGSLSLGVAREFRVRRVSARDEPPAPTAGSTVTAAEAADNGPASPSGPNVSPPLGPKATVVAAAATLDENAQQRADMDGQIAIHLPHNSLLVMHAEMQEEWKHSIAPARSIVPHPLAGNKRLNITYRHYRAHMHPRFTPRCKCGVPCALRCVQRARASRGRYCWMCHAGYMPGKEGCGWFEWAVFDGDGRPSWADGFLGEGVEGKEPAAHVNGEERLSSPGRGSTTTAPAPTGAAGGDGALGQHRRAPES